jgi:eukaryotic-like serine/threonine-protein kinase
MRRRVSHYEILDRIGGGGMGVVFKAQDLKLNRLVAIKFLATDTTDDREFRERFLREARVASSLDHPNICTIYEIDEDEDHQLFMVMAYYEGETLGQKIQAGPLPMLTGLEYASQLLSGLAFAHESGIIHRDIKPNNLLITRRNELKILDFGLARLLEETAMTRPGRLQGTLAYMAPEQASGRDLDHRCDIWSAGAVVYEMLVGKRAFPGQTALAILRSIENDELQSVSAIRREISPRVDDILRRALAKDLNARYQSTAEFLRDIEALRSAPPDSPGLTAAPSASIPSERSILVLPFVSLSPGTQGDYLADGLTDEIITDLCAIHDLRVISRTSAMRLKATSDDLRKIAGDLRVRYVLEGSVRTSGESLRVNVKLVDALKDALLWSHKLGGSLADVFTVEEAVSRKVVEALKLKLGPEEKKIMARRPISDFRAYEYYLRAKQEILQYSKESLDRALDLLNNATAIVGENVLLVAAMGQVYWIYLNAGITSDPSYVAKVQECADRVLALDPESPHGHRLIGLLQLRQGNVQEAARRLKQVLVKDAFDSETLSWLIAIYAYAGKPYAAAPWAKTLLEIDPLTPAYQTLPGLLAMMAGEYRRALGPMAKGLKLEPENPAIRFCYGQLLVLNKRMDEGVEVFDALVKEMADSFFAKLALAWKYGALGNREGVLGAMTEDLKTAAAGDLQFCWNLAQCFAAVNEKEQALEWLGKAVQLGFTNYPMISHLDPFLENLRGEPRFEQLLESARERWEAFEV